MKLVLREKRLEEREVAGSSLENQVHVSPNGIDKALQDVTNFPRPATFNRRHTKPAGFYTSSAYKMQDKMSSEWADFMRSEQYGTFGSIVVLKVNPSARIAIVENADDYMELLYQYDYNPLYKEGKALNFDGIAKDFDGFRITSDGYSEIRDISYGWDVEQTVWFNNKVLTPVPLKEDSEIRAPKGSKEYLDQKYNYISQFDTKMASYGDY